MRRQAKKLHENQHLGGRTWSKSARQSRFFGGIWRLSSIFAHSNRISACAAQRRTAWRPGMPEGPVGLCFFEQFVSQADAGEGKQGQNTHTGNRCASMPHHPSAKPVSAGSIL